MATSNYFLDKLSAETRVTIYGFLFDSSEHVIRTRNDGVSDTRPAVEDVRRIVHGLPRQEAVQDTMIESAIFAVNKHISAEALETFYNAKTVRLTFEQLGGDGGVCGGSRMDYLNFVRRVEVVDCIGKFPEAEDVRERLLRPSLRMAQGLPRLTSITILTDCLAYVSEVQTPITVARFAQYAGLGEVVCTDVGRFTLQGELHSVKLANSKLLKMWPSVVDMPEDYDAWLEARNIVRKWNFGGVEEVIQMAWASHTSLRLWVGLSEQAVAAVGLDKAWPPPDNDPDSDYARWHDLVSWTVSISSGNSIRSTPQGADGARVPLHKLGPQHDPATLTWATEFLAMNIETYYAQNDKRDYQTTRVCWPELEGRQCVDSEISRRAVVRRDERAVIVNPVDDRYQYTVSALRSMLQNAKPLKDLLRFSDQDVTAVSIADLAKIFNPTIAMGFWEGSTDDSSKMQRLGDWSATLLCKYLGRIKGFSKYAVEEASLQKLQE
ncbi:hypothetical protein LTR85_011021 [Meristemomyces frigidus]|nr:hypothetical protein LTR85_011021 [Meristemomyces frigidus]